MPEPRSNVSQKNFDPSVYSLVQIFCSVVTMSTERFCDQNLKILKVLFSSLEQLPSWITLKGTSFFLAHVFKLPDHMLKVYHILGL